MTIFMSVFIFMSFLWSAGAANIELGCTAGWLLTIARVINRLRQGKKGREGMRLTDAAGRMAALAGLSATMLDSVMATLAGLSAT